MTTADSQPDAFFPQFARLPRELRDRIWFFAAPAPADDDPAVFFYFKGLLKQYRPERGDYAFDHDYYDIDLYCRFCHEDLDAVPVYLALAQVNKEARDAVFLYAYSLGYETFKLAGSKAPVLGRRMIPTKDILFLKDGDFSVLFEEWWDLLVDEEDCFSDYPGPRTWAVNSSEVLLSPEYLSGALCEMASVQAIYIFVCPEEERKRSSHGGLQTQRIGIKPDGGRSWVCSEDGTTWRWGPGCKVGTDDLNDVVEKCTVDMSNPTSSKWGSEFSVRIVEAVRA